MTAAFTPKVRRMVVDRQDGACATCANVIVNTIDYSPLYDDLHPRAPQWHHRPPRRSGGRHGPMARLAASPANCLLLCASHHVLIERERERALSFGWLLHERQDPLGETPVFHLGGWVLLTDGPNVIGLPEKEPA